MNSRTLSLERFGLDPNRRYYAYDFWNEAGGFVEDGVLRFGALSFIPIELTTADGVQTFTPPMPEHVQQPLVQTVVDELRGCGKAASTGENALRVSWVMDQILGTI